MKKALENTGTDWPTLERVYGCVHRLADVLGEENVRAEERQMRLLLILMHMQEQANQLDPVWQKAIAHFRQPSLAAMHHICFSVIRSPICHAPTMA